MEALKKFVLPTGHSPLCHVGEGETLAQAISLLTVLQAAFIDSGVIYSKRPIEAGGDWESTLETMTPVIIADALGGVASLVAMGLCAMKDKEDSNAR